MGTSTIYLRHNDLARDFSTLTKKELQEIDGISPFRDNKGCFGWRASMELHNGNIYPLIFWKGRLMKLEEAPKALSKKYYNKYTGKYMRAYEWTLLKNMLLRDIQRLDKKFKKLKKFKKKC